MIVAVEINRDQLNENKGYLFRAYYNKESTTSTCVLAEPLRQAESWERGKASSKLCEEAVGPGKLEAG